MMVGEKIPWTRPERKPSRVTPPPAPELGCCSACGGTGGDGGAACWDCQGTGHPHAGACITDETKITQCKTCLGSGILYVKYPTETRERQCWTCNGTGLGVL